MDIREMTTSECQSALAGARLGRLACAHENQPYVVPIYFVYEEPYLYGFTTLGQKVEWMRSNPPVCVELDEVEDYDQWMSILVFGWYEELQAPPASHESDQEPRRPLSHEAWEQTAQQRWVSSSPDQEPRLHAHKLLQEQRTLWCQPGCASRKPAQPLTPIFYRIRIDRVSGRRATPSPSDRYQSSPCSASRDNQGGLRRVFHALVRWFGGAGMKRAD
jgi:nitroimidazol reductase NimA-like FMN-containing flavoprotein (pyridoxamine 5'-phosphate oxidase superfamily)